MRVQLQERIQYLYFYSFSVDSDLNFAIYYMAIYPTLAREFQGFGVWGNFASRMLPLTVTPTNLANQVKVGHARDESQSIQLRVPEKAHQNKA